MIVAFFSTLKKETVRHSYIVGKQDTTNNHLIFSAFLFVQLHCANKRPTNWKSKEFLQLFHIPQNYAAAQRGCVSECSLLFNFEGKCSSLTCCRATIYSKQSLNIFRNHFLPDYRGFDVSYPS